MPLSWTCHFRVLCWVSHFLIAECCHSGCHDAECRYVECHSFLLLCWVSYLLIAMLNVIFLYGYVECLYAECHHYEYCYAKCLHTQSSNAVSHYAECRFAECHIFLLLCWMLHKNNSMLNAVFSYGYAECCYAEGHHAKCCNADNHYAECHHAQCCNA